MIKQFSLLPVVCGLALASIGTVAQAGQATSWECALSVDSVTFAVPAERFGFGKLPGHLEQLNLAKLAEGDGFTLEIVTHLDSIPRITRTDRPEILNPQGNALFFSLVSAADIATVHVGYIFSDLHTPNPKVLKTTSVIPNESDFSLGLDDMRTADGDIGTLAMSRNITHTKTSVGYCGDDAADRARADRQAVIEEANDRSGLSS